MAATIERRPAAGAGDRAQQDAGRAALQRVPRVLPRERSRVLRQLLRLLPARGLRPGAGPLHREGLVDQRRDRPAAPRRHRLAVRPQGRDHRRLRLLHLRDRLAAALPRPDAALQGRRLDRPRRSCSASWSACSTAATTPTSAAACFSARGEVLEIMPAYAESAYRIQLFGDEIEAIQHFDPLTGEVLDEHRPRLGLAGEPLRDRGGDARALGRRDRARAAQPDRLFDEQGKQLEAHRLQQRTNYDMEMLRELGFCSGIENYSRILDGRKPGSPPYTLIDYFPDDFVCFLDESHQTIPQIGGMSEGDFSRKTTLVEHGFRLPSAIDNRPLKFDEFLDRVGQMVLLSATPGPWERAKAERVVEQIVRPTGIVDPEVEVRETKNQIDDLMNEVRIRAEQQRARAGHDADQEDGRGPDRVPAGARLPGPLPALRGGHAGAHPDHPRAAAGRVRRAGRRQPAAGGPRPARGLPGRDPRRRQGGLPPRRDQPDPDDRPRRPERQGQGADVRGQGDRRDAGGDPGDRPPPRRSRSPTTRSTASRRRP